MIDKEIIQKTVQECIDDTQMFIVGINVTPDNVITVTIDSPTGVDTDTCVKITHAIEGACDRDVEDYELEVGSAGITAPMTVRRQFEMNIGNDVEILTRDGRKIHAVLSGVNQDFTEITVEVPTKVKHPGAKRPIVENVPETLTLANCKTVIRELKF